MRCEYCGAEAGDEILTVYCKKCGRKLRREETSAPQGQEAGTQGQEAAANGKKRRKWYWLAAGCGVLLLAGVMTILVVMQGPEAFRNIGGNHSSEREEALAKLYGEWSDENGLLSMTFREDGTLRVGAGAGFLGADLFTFTEEGGNTLQLKANAEGALSAVSLELDYEIQEDTMTISFLGMDYVLKRK